MFTITSINTCSIEQLSPGLLLERSLNGQLCIFTIKDNSPETLNKWATHVKKLLQEWPIRQPCLMLHDLHHSGGLAFNREMQEMFLELYTWRPELTQYVSVVLPHDLSADVARLSVKVRELVFPYEYPVHWEIFTSRRDAFTWLLEQAA